ncbi:hypothetical protein WICMUC_001532 [Wickerhamomyces mucosus]|uniref:Uncharacterized protein n=1 Tax=Wickerhamomyces mucosus TaxID=1378264 RepID=A0A9P8TH70_9ASCO|nr:hypothetical protein WICMUC_001532 [Wickerhamomyces mucosus]
MVTTTTQFHDDCCSKNLSNDDIITNIISETRIERDILENSKDVIDYVRIGSSQTKTSTKLITTSTILSQGFGIELQDHCCASKQTDDKVDSPGSNIQVESLDSPDYDSVNDLNPFKNYPDINCFDDYNSIFERSVNSNSNKEHRVKELFDKSSQVSAFSISVLDKTYIVDGLFGLEISQSETSEGDLNIYNFENSYDGFNEILIECTDNKNKAISFNSIDTLSPYSTSIKSKSNLGNTYQHCITEKDQLGCSFVSHSLHSESINNDSNLFMEKNETLGQYLTSKGDFYRENGVDYLGKKTCGFSSIEKKIKEHMIVTPDFAALNDGDLTQLFNQALCKVDSNNCEIINEDNSDYSSCPQGKKLRFENETFTINNENKLSIWNNNGNAERSYDSSLAMADQSPAKETFHLVDEKNDWIESLESAFKLNKQIVVEMKVDECSITSSHGVQNQSSGTILLSEQEVTTSPKNSVSVGLKVSLNYEEIKQAEIPKVFYSISDCSLVNTEENISENAHDHFRIVEAHSSPLILSQDFTKHKPDEKIGNTIAQDLSIHNVHVIDRTKEEEEGKIQKHSIIPEFRSLQDLDAKALGLLPNTSRFSDRDMVNEINNENCSKSQNSEEHFGCNNLEDGVVPKDSRPKFHTIDDTGLDTSTNFESPPEVGSITSKPCSETIVDNYNGNATFDAIQSEFLIENTRGTPINRSDQLKPTRSTQWRINNRFSNTEKSVEPAIQPKNIKHIRKIVFASKHREGISGKLNKVEKTHDSQKIDNKSPKRVWYKSIFGSKFSSIHQKSSYFNGRSNQSTSHFDMERTLEQYSSKRTEFIHRPILSEKLTSYLGFFGPHAAPHHLNSSVHVFEDLTKKTDQLNWMDSIPATFPPSKRRKLMFLNNGVQEWESHNSVQTLDGNFKKEEGQISEKHSSNRFDRFHELYENLNTFTNRINLRSIKSEDIVLPSFSRIVSLEKVIGSNFSVNSGSFSEEVKSIPPGLANKTDPISKKKYLINRNSFSSMLKKLKIKKK